MLFRSDVILTRGDDLNTCPVHDPIQTLVFMATPFNVDTVFVNGTVKKRGGKLVYPEGALRETLGKLTESGRRILDAAGVFSAAAE